MKATVEIFYESYMSSS